MLEILFFGSLTTMCLVGCVTFLLLYWALRRLRYRLPPGPTPLPLLGNIFQLDFKTLHKQAYEWSKKYGPVISVYIGPMHFVYVNNIETALEVLVKKSTDFAGRIDLCSLNTLFDGRKDIVFGDYGPTWHLHRKISSKALREYLRGDKLEAKVLTAIRKTVDKLEKESGPFRPLEYLTIMVADVLVGLCFGENANYEEYKIHHLQKLTDEVFFESNVIYLEDIFPTMRYFYKTKSFKTLEEYADFSRKLLTNMFEKEESTFDKNNIRHYVDFLLLAKYEAEQEEGKDKMKSLTRSHLVQTCKDVLIAGIDTSRRTLDFAILYMLKYPESQEKVHDELERVLGRNRLPCIADLPNLSYTEAVLHECMRLSTVVPSGIFHMTTCDTTAGGYNIPKGTAVAINHWALHNDPNAWEDVDKFIPERYLDENGKMGPTPKNWLPFSAGKRVCLGKSVAKPELHLFFAALMQKFTWKPEPGIVPDLTSYGNFVGQVPKSYKVVVEKRF